MYKHLYRKSRFLHKESVNRVLNKSRVVVGHAKNADFRNSSIRPLLFGNWNGLWQPRGCSDLVQAHFMVGLLLLVTSPVGSLPFG